LLGIDFVNCGYNFSILGGAELLNESIRKKGGKGKCIFGDKEQLE
jgi:hypothetical protein